MNNENETSNPISQETMYLGTIIDHIKYYTTKIIKVCTHNSK